MRKSKVPRILQPPKHAPVKHTAEEFRRRYEELCKEMGFAIVFAPQWAQSKDTGDYRLVILSSVQPIAQDAS